jgi:thioesterase domain-containing protein
VLEVGQRQRWIFPEVTLAQFGQFVKILKTHTEAWRQYTPRPYPGKITLFVSDDEEVKISLSDRWQSLVAKIIPGRIGPNSTDQKAEVNVQAEDMGWGDLARGGVEVYYTPGDHISMIHKPHVKQLAERLKVSLEAVTLKEKVTET